MVPLGEDVAMEMVLEVGRSEARVGREGLLR